MSAASGVTRPEISLELITRLLERRGNWLITFPLGRCVTGITLHHSAASQPAPGITNTNLTPVTRDINCECSGVTESGQDTETFMPFNGTTEADIRTGGCVAKLAVQHFRGMRACRVKLQPAAVWPTWDVPKATIS